MAQNPLLESINSSPRAQALAIDQATPLPVAAPSSSPYPESDVVSELDNLDIAGQDVVPQPTRLRRNPLLDMINGTAPASSLPKGNPLLEMIRATEAATKQAVAEATTPAENLPVLKPDLANALGVLDYRDPEEGARRQKAAAMGEILGLPEYEKVKLGAAPTNADGTVTIRRAQAVSPEANAAANLELNRLRQAAAAEMNPPSRITEAGNRFMRGAREGWQDVRSGLYGIVENFFKPEQNPYIFTPDQIAAAKSDIPFIEQQISALEAQRSDYMKGARSRMEQGGRLAQDSGDAKSPYDEKISNLRFQLGQAKSASEGVPPTESMAGSLSRAAGELSKEAIVEKNKINSEYGPSRIQPKRDQEFWMNVAGSIGSSAPSTLSTMLNPALGLTMMYGQTYAGAAQEYEASAAKAGKLVDPSARDAYAHEQSLMQVPWEIIGDVAVAGVAKKALSESGQAIMRAFRKGDVASASSLVSQLPKRFAELGAAAAGETLLTTPAQTIIEQKLAEQNGVRLPISNAQLAENTWDAMKVAGAQSLILGGGPVVLQNGIEKIAPRITAQPATAEVPQNFTPISSPAPTAPTGQAPRTLGQVRAPEIPIDQTALDEAFGSTFAPPPEVSTFAPPAPVNTALPTDALPTETPGATYGREAEIYDAFANVRRAPLTETPPAASAFEASTLIAPEPTGSPELISGEGASVPTPFDFERASVYATSSGAKDLQQASNGISSTLAQIRDKRLASPYQSDFQAELFAQTEGITSNPGYAAAGIKSTDAGSSEVSEQDYDRLVEEGLQGNWQSLAGAIAMRGKASSIFPDLVDGKIPVWNIVGTQIETPADLVATLLPLRSPYVESIKVAVLDSKNKVVSSEVVSVGTINEGILHARELTRSLARVRKNTKQNFNKIVISHNHPSGDPAPSGADLNITRRLDEAANAMGFEVVDHVITNGTKFYSFKSGFNGDNSVFAGDSSFNLTSKGVGPEAVDISIPSKPAPIFEPSKAKWERVGRVTLPYMDNYQATEELLSVLKQGDPNAGHILYLNTKLRLTAVERIPNISSYENDPSKLVELKRRIMETAALDGAYGFIFHTPEKGGRSELLNQLTLFSRQAQLPMLDYAATDPNNPDLFYSAKSEGLLMEEAPQFLNEQPGTGPKPRKFTQSVQAAEGVMPEVKAQLNSFEYDPVSNAETVAAARAGIDAAGSIDAAYTGLMGKTAAPNWQPSAVDYATGMELMSQLQNRGRHEDAGAIANMMANRATDQGRAIQALSMISRLGPQGIEVFAQRTLTQAATSGKTEKQRTAIQAKIDEADQLRGEVGKVRHGAATAAIVGNKDLIKGELPAGVDPVKVNLAIRDAIMGSPTPLAAEAATHTILTDQGISDKGAVRISKSIVRDFLKTSQDARAKVLQDLQAAAENDRRLDKSKLGDLMRLNREGQLTDAKLHAGMAKMLGIPHWGAEQSAKVQRILAQREKATDPRIKLVKAAEALDVVYREFMPPGLLAKVDTFQTLMMLLNPKTVGRNVIGNTLMASADFAADAVAIPMDALLSLGTGERTRTGLSLGERIVGLGAGVGDIKAGYDFARSEGRGVLPSLAAGVDTLVRLGRLQSSGKYDSAQISAYSGGTFTMPVFRHLETTLGAVLSIADRGFYESAFRSSLDNRMNAARANGTPMLAPDTEMIEAARMDAGRAVYQDKNIASTALSGLRRVLNANQRWGLGSMLMKFTQVPGSILMRGVEFSPLGFINNAYQGIAPLLVKNREFDQKAFTDSFTRAIVGTTGLVATGYWLAQLGIISAGSDAKDEDKRNLDRATGWGNYRLNVDALKRALLSGNFWTRQKQQPGDMVVSYDWAQPLSISVAMGAYARENQDAVRQDILQGKKQSLLATGMNWLAFGAGAASGAMNSLVEQPLLQGINRFMRDASYTNLPGAILKTAADAPGTFIPSAARQWMQLDDNSVRETRDSSPFRQYINELKAQLPGQSKTLPQKYDIAGQPIERWAQDGNTIFNVLFNPGMVSYIKNSPVLTEMGEIYRRTADGKAVANMVKPEFTLEGVKVRLTDEEISAMQKDMGALSIAAIEKFVLSDPRYATATWDIKAKAFTRALEKAATAAKYRILLARPDLTARARQDFLNTRAARSEQQALME